MTDRIPLIVHTSAQQIQELPNADDLVLSGQLKMTGTTSGASDINLSGGNDAISVVGITSNKSNLSQLSIDCKNNADPGADVTVAQFKVSGTNNTPSLSVTVPSGRTPIVSNTPSFRATLGADQMLSNYTRTAVAFGAEDFDSDGCYNNTGSAVTLNGISVPAYSFAPNVAGFYYVFASTSIQCNQDELKFARVQITKNGSSDNEVKAACINGVDGGGNTIKFKEATQTASIIIEMNGTSDYITIYSDADHDNAAGATLTLPSPPTVRSYVHAYKLIM